MGAPPEVDHVHRHLSDREGLLLTSRLLSVGEMASVIAHELNQPLGAIVNLLAGLKLRTQRGEPWDAAQAAALDRALDQARFAGDVIARMRSFVEQRSPRMEPLDLGALVGNTLDLMDWEFQRAAVTVALDAEPSPLVLGDRTMLQQVIANLLRNALEAMRDQSAARRIDVRIGRAESEVRMLLHDTGPGIDAVLAGTMFEPFKTSKASGMGVGLALCRSILELHHGRLWFDPSGQGAVVVVALPHARSDAP